MGGFPLHPDPAADRHPCLTSQGVAGAGAGQDEGGGGRERKEGAERREQARTQRGGWMGTSGVGRPWRALLDVSSSEKS